MICFSLKHLIFKQLQPIAQSLGCKLLILDNKTYNSKYLSLQNRLTKLGIEKNQSQKIINYIEEYGLIGILKSNKYLGIPEIVPSFSELGLTDSDIYYLHSVEAKYHKFFGDLDNSIPKNKRKFFYWFPIAVENENHDLVMESN